MCYPNNTCVRTTHRDNEKHLGDAAPGVEGSDMTTQEVGHLGVEVKLHEDAARIAEHHDESHQLVLRLANGDLPKMPPLCRYPDYAE